MKDTESLFTPAMDRALQERQARSLLVACHGLASQLLNENLHRDPARAVFGFEQLLVMTRNAQASAVDVCRDQGVTWDRIADQVGITRQAAMQRWS